MPSMPELQVPLLFDPAIGCYALLRRPPSFLVRTGEPMKLDFSSVRIRLRFLLYVLLPLSIPRMSQSRNTNLGKWSHATSFGSGKMTTGLFFIISLSCSFLAVQRSLFFLAISLQNAVALLQSEPSIQLSVSQIESVSSFSFKKYSFTVRSLNSFSDYQSTSDSCSLKTCT